MRRTPTGTRSSKRRAPTRHVSTSPAAAAGSAPAPPGARLGLACAGAAILAFVLYSTTLTAPFVYDDIVYVRDNTFVHDPANLPRLWTTAYPPDRPHLGLYRPVTATSYTLDVALGGVAPRQFHLTSIALHAVASALAVLVVFNAGTTLPAAALAGALFAAHPIHTEAVAWISGRAEILAALGCLGACLAWWHFRRTKEQGAFAAAMLLYFLGLGAKETSAPLPVVLLLAEGLGLARGRAGSIPVEESATPPRPSLLPYMGFVAVFLAYTVLRVIALQRFSMLPDMTAFMGDPLHVRLLSAVAGFGRYVAVSIVPTGLRVDYSDFKFASALDAPVVAGAATGALLVMSAVLLRRRVPAVSFWIGWFLLFTIPFSNLLVPIGTVAAERFVYIASLAACALAGLALSAGLDASRSWLLRRVTALTSVALLGSLSAATLARNIDWGDPVRLFRTEVARSPRSEKAHLNLARLLWEHGRQAGDGAMLREAETVFRAGIALGTPAGAALTSDHVELLYQYGNYHRDQGRASEALPHYAQVARLMQTYPLLKTEVPFDFHLWYGAALEAAGQLDGARAQYEAARAAQPGSSLPLKLVAQAALHQGRIDEAIGLYRQVLAADPAFSAGYINLGLLLAERSRLDKALAVLAAFRRAVPVTAQSAYDQGFLAERLGQTTEAAADYRRALELDPGHAEARQALTALESRLRQ